MHWNYSPHIHYQVVKRGLASHQSSTLVATWPKALHIKALSMTSNHDFHTPTWWDRWSDDSIQEDETNSRPVNHDSGFHMTGTTIWTFHFNFLNMTTSQWQVTYGALQQILEKSGTLSKHHGILIKTIHFFHGRHYNTVKALARITQPNRTRFRQKSHGARIWAETS